MKMPAQVKGTKYRLSPNEEARLLKEEREKRRKIRLVQVREQAKANAARIRDAVKLEQDRQLQKLAFRLKSDWENEQKEKVAELEKQYRNNVQAVGESHYEANQPDHRSELRAALLKEDKRRAAERFRIAMEKLKEENYKKEQDENQQIFARKIALEKERLRANQIAALPPPPPDPLLNIQVPKTRPVQIVDKDAFSTTYFHMSDGYGVDKAEPGQQSDARCAAIEEEERTKDLEAEIKRSEHERLEKARLRHKHARNKELLKQDYNRMLLDLSDLQRADRHRRQQIVANIPKKVFQPPHKRMEDSEDKQQTLEQAFEDMYMAGTDYMGDITLALDPHPVPATPAASDALDLSFDGPADTIGQVKSVFKDVTNQKTPEKKKPIIDKDKTPDTGLRRLFGKIKAQRDEWATSSNQDTAHVDEPPNSKTVPPEVVHVPSKHHFDTVSLSGTSVKSGSQLTDTSETFRSTEVSNTMTSGSLFTTKSSAHSMTDTGTSENLERFCRINEDTEQDTETVSDVQVHAGKPSPPVNLDRFQRRAQYYQDDMRDVAEPSMEESIITGSPTLYHPMEAAERTRRRALEQREMAAQRRLDKDALEQQTAPVHLVDKQNQLSEQKTELESRIQSILARRKMLEEQLAKSQISYQTQVLASSGVTSDPPRSPGMSVTQATPGASAQAIRQRLDEINRQAAAIKPVTMTQHSVSEGQRSPSQAPVAPSILHGSLSMTADSQPHSNVSDVLSSDVSRREGRTDNLQMTSSLSGLPSLSESRFAVVNIERQRAKIEEYRRKIKERKPTENMPLMSPTHHSTVLPSGGADKKSPSLIGSLHPDTEDRLSYMSSRVRELHQQSAELLDEFSTSSGLIEDKDDSAKSPTTTTKALPQPDGWSGSLRQRSGQGDLDLIHPSNGRHVDDVSTRGVDTFSADQPLDPSYLMPASQPSVQLYSTSPSPQSDLIPSRVTFPATSYSYLPPTQERAGTRTSSLTSRSGGVDVSEMQNEFDLRQNQLQNQLTEIRRQKDEIVARQKEQELTVTQIRRNWLQELAPYKVPQDEDTSQSQTGNGGRSNGIEDEQLVDLFNRVISGKPIASRPLPPDQEFEEFRAPVVSRPPPSHLTLLQGHIPHELSVIAEADTPASSSMGASLRSSSHVSGMRMNPIDEHSVSVMGALGESPYLKTRSDDLTETNLLGSGQPQQMGYHDNSIRPHSDVEHPPSQRSLVDLATTVTPTDQIEVIQENASPFDWMSPAFSTGPLAEDTEEFHPDAGGITISSTPGRSDTSLSTSTSDHTHDGLWIPDHAREDRWRSTVQPPDDHSADDPWGSSHARPDVWGNSVLMSAPDDHKIDRSIQLSTPVIQSQTEDGFLPLQPGSGSTEPWTGSPPEKKLLQQSSDYDASVLDRFTELPPGSASSVSGAISPVDLSQYPLSGIVSTTNRSRVTDSSPDVMKRFEDDDSNVSVKEDETNVNSTRENGGDLSEHPLPEDVSDTTTSLSQYPMDSPQPSLSSLMREPERLISVEKVVGQFLERSVSFEGSHEMTNQEDNALDEGNVDKMGLMTGRVMPQALSNDEDKSKLDELSQYPMEAMSTIHQSPAVNEDPYNQMSFGDKSDSHYGSYFSTAPLSITKQSQASTTTTTTTTEDVSKLSTGPLETDHLHKLTSDGQFMQMQESSQSSDRSPLDTRLWSAVPMMTEASTDQMTTLQQEPLSLGVNDARHVYDMISDTDTGITDEPDLTLVSITSEAPIHQSDASMNDPSAIVNDPSQMATLNDPDMSASLMSFEQHELSARYDNSPSKRWTELSADSSQATQHDSRPWTELAEDASQATQHDSRPWTELAEDASQATRNDSSSFEHLPEDLSGEYSSGAEAARVSLQEAFMQKKKGFIQATEKRQEEVKSGHTTRGHHGQLNQVLSSWKQSRATKSATEKQEKPVSMTTKTPSDRKKAEKEMYERNKRLYSKLEEVKIQKQEKQRQEEYASNREKAKQYHKQLQEKRKKKTAKKS